METQPKFEDKKLDSMKNTPKKNVFASNLTSVEINMANKVIKALNSVSTQESGDKRSKRSPAYSKQTSLTTHDKMSSLIKTPSKTALGKDKETNGVNKDITNKSHMFSPLDQSTSSQPGTSRNHPKMLRKDGGVSSFIERPKTASNVHLSKTSNELNLPTSALPSSIVRNQNNLSSKKEHTSQLETIPEPRMKQASVERRISTNPAPGGMTSAHMRPPSQRSSIKETDKKATAEESRRKSSNILNKLLALKEGSYPSPRTHAK